LGDCKPFFNVFINMQHRSNLVRKNIFRDKYAARRSTIMFSAVWKNIESFNALSCFTPRECVVSLSICSCTSMVWLIFDLRTKLSSLKNELRESFVQ
jgi:hypothetical protein